MVEEYSNEPVHKKHRTKIIVFGIFLIVLFILVYTSFYELPITGNIIKSNPNSNNSITLSADLTTPVLSLNGEFEKVNIFGSSESFLYAGDKKFPLSNSEENSIILTDYDGEISFDENVVSNLKGTTMKISVNGVPMISKSDGKMKIYFDSDFNYNTLEIKKGASIKKLDYETSGIVNLDEKTIINLEEDNLVIERFYGDIKIENNRCNFKGYLTALNVEGNQQISVSA